LFDFAEIWKFLKEDLVKLDEHCIVENTDDKEWTEAFKIMLKASIEKGLHAGGGSRVTGVVAD
jgi:hypothetical protein